MGVHARLAAEVPFVMLLKIPGAGPKHVKALSAGVTSDADSPVGWRLYLPEVRGQPVEAIVNESRVVIRCEARVIFVSFCLWIFYQFCRPFSSMISASLRHHPTTVQKHPISSDNRVTFTSNWKLTSNLCTLACWLAFGWSAPPP